MATDGRSDEPIRGRFGREEPSRVRRDHPPRGAFREAPEPVDPRAGGVGTGGGMDDPADEPPPGWDARDDYRGAGGGDGAAPRPGMPDLGSVLALVEGLRGAVPREVQDQLNALVRELLLSLRALIDWYVERLDAPREEPEVEDIPID